jgi:hypothetical protein
VITRWPACDEHRREEVGGVAVESGEAVRQVRNTTV